MPIKNDLVVCINHPEIPMVRNESLTAMVQVDKSPGDEIVFNLGAGLIAQTYVCKSCGYVETYWERKYTNRKEPGPSKPSKVAQGERR